MPLFSEGLPLRMKGMDLRRMFSSAQQAAEHNWIHPCELGGSDFTSSLLSGGLRVWDGSWGFGNYGFKYAVLWSWLKLAIWKKKESEKWTKKSWTEWRIIMISALTKWKQAIIRMLKASLGYIKPFLQSGKETDVNRRQICDKWLFYWISHGSWSVSQIPVLLTPNTPDLPVQMVLSSQCAMMESMFRSPIFKSQWKHNSY